MITIATAVITTTISPLTLAHISSSVRAPAPAPVTVTPAPPTATQSKPPPAADPDAMDVDCARYFNLRNVICHKCQKKGHIARNCWQRPGQTRSVREAQVEESAEPAQKNEEVKEEGKEEGWTTELQ